MHIGAAETKGTDRCCPGDTLPGLPLLQLGVDIERTVFKIDEFIFLFKI